MYDHIHAETVFRCYPQVAVFESNNGAFDVDGNVVDLDLALLEAENLTTSTEKKWTKLRMERDRLIAETDWVVSRAVDASNDGLGIQLPQVWVDYRQALRDLPANTVDPANPVWPVKPE